MKVYHQVRYYMLCFLVVIVIACRGPKTKEVLKNQHKGINPAINEEDQVVNMIMDLDEVKRKNALVMKESNGKRRLSTYVETLPTVADPYYWVKVAEDNGGNFVTYYSFGVQAKTHVIMFYDVMQGSLISLSQWRKTTPVGER